MKESILRKLIFNAILAGKRSQQRLEEDADDEKKKKKKKEEECVQRCLDDTHTHTSRFIGKSTCTLLTTFCKKKDLYFSPEIGNLASIPGCPSGVFTIARLPASVKNLSGNALAKSFKRIFA